MYLQTLGTEEQDLGFAWARAFRMPAFNFPKIVPPRLPAPPRINIPRIVPPRINPPKINIPKINVPKIAPPKINVPKITPPKINIDTKKLGQQLTRPTQQMFKSLSQAGKGLSQGLESIFKNFAPPGQMEPEPMEPEPMEQFYENEQFTTYDNEPILTEEPIELTEQESKEMLGAITQGQAGMLNTGLSVASSFFPAAMPFMPMAQNLISSAQKKPAKKPNPLQLLAQLQKKPAPKPVVRATPKPVVRATPKPIVRAVEEKKDNTLLIVGGIGILALLMISKKK